MIRFILPLALTLLTATASTAETITITGQNGGTLQGTRTCARSTATIHCTGNYTTTTPAGATGTRTRATTVTQGSATSILSGIRPGGRSFGRTTTITR